MSNEVIKDFINYIRLTAGDKKLFKTSQFRRVVYDVYLNCIVNNKNRQNREYIEILARFLSYLSHKKRIGINRINSYLNELETVYNNATNS